MPENEEQRPRNAEELHSLLGSFNDRIRSLETSFSENRESLEESFQNVENYIDDYENRISAMETSLEPTGIAAIVPKKYLDIAKKIGLGILTIFALYGGCSCSQDAQSIYNGGCSSSTYSTINNAVKDLEEQQTRKYLNRLEKFIDSEDNSDN